MTEENEPVFIGWYEESAYGPGSDECMFESLGPETVTIQRTDWEEAGSPNPIAVRFEEATEAQIAAYSGTYPDEDAEAPQIESSQASQVKKEPYWDDDKNKQHQSREM
jgi:hypothetical protein